MKRILLSVALVLGAALTAAMFTGAPPAKASKASSGLRVKTNIVVHSLNQYVAGVVVPNPQNLYFNGGTVQTATSVYISWWGPEWASGFSSGGYTSQQAQTYSTDFFNNVGGSKWIGTDTQYCQNVPTLTFDCSGYASAQYITNPAAQLKGTWNDTTAVPASPADADIAAAALRAVSHFGYNANATYLVYTPTGKNETGFNTVWCAWHNTTTSQYGAVAYGYIPYQPDAGANCGMNFVNKSNDAYGHGYFDGFSIVGGHEYEEAQTDPGAGSGWTDATGYEDGDKCAWNALSSNITLGSNYYAAQPVWSNAIGGCTMG